MAMSRLFQMSCVLLAFIPCSLQAQQIHRDVPYADAHHARQVLDVYSPANASNAPIVFWIHGGGWQAGDKTDVQIKPAFFNERGFVFVSVNYRLLPEVTMTTLIDDVANAFAWVHQHASEYGGDGNSIWIMGHSAGAQLAAILATDEAWLTTRKVPMTALKGCVPVDGDTYDIPAIIELAETRWRLHGLPPAKFGHREKFEGTPERHRHFSAVTHIAPGRRIPPFLILHVAEHPDTSAQAVRLANALENSKLQVTRFGARDTTHGRINEQLGTPGDPATDALIRFLEQTR